MQIRAQRFFRLGAVLTLSAVLVLVVFASGASGQVQHVRWDIISLGFTTPPTFNPGGFSEAKAPDNTKIRLTGSGTFVAPSGGNGGSNDENGGGNWTTFSATTLASDR